MTHQTCSIDLHPDPDYKVYSSTEQEDACHRGKGPAGVLGAETSDCDSPFSLINATFKWIDENIKDSIDFVIWTGDSARHDNDELTPRTDKQVEDSNEMLVNKFVEVFGKEDNINDTDPTNDFIVPIVPTLGNNDILPHNIMDPGPNKWTRAFLRIWRKFIPEEQRHGFERGGWFFVEVIPNELAVFNLNTLYFFTNNAAVDGCADESEIGYEQMTWLRVQLQFIRQRGMKAIIIGHVPPARTETKRSWDETCWQKYTFWMHQYRDIIVGSMYGHMNIEHFILQDSNDVDEKVMNGQKAGMWKGLNGQVTMQNAASYFVGLRAQWSRLPNAVKTGGETIAVEEDIPLDINRSWKKSPKWGKQKKSKQQKFYEKIGGQWGERYSVTLVSASIVPNYFPTIRVIEYNTTGLERSRGASSLSETDSLPFGSEPSTNEPDHLENYSSRKGKKTHRFKKPKFIPPLSPSKSAPPGPAYSPQTFTWLSYTQYYANLTRINNDFPEPKSESDIVETEKWHKGKHSGKKPHEGSNRRPRPEKFAFEVEYDTRTDKAYNLKDLTVRSWMSLARRIGQYRPDECSCAEDSVEVSENDDMVEQSGPGIKGSRGDVDLVSAQKHKKEKKKHKKHNRRKKINQAWFTFLSRAFVSTRNEDELRDEFG